MISLDQQRPPYKLPGKNSFFVRFNYNQAIVDTIKQVPNAIWHKKLSVWEIPVTSLSKAVNMLSNFDDIAINLLEDEVTGKVQEVELDVSKYITHPYPYQLEGITYGLQHDKFLLLDAPGLGKTLQMIYLAQEHKERDGIEHCLIVCGVNTLKHNWKKEIQKHSNLSCRILGERTTKKGKERIGSVKERVDDLMNPIDEFFVISNIETFRSTDIIDAIKKGPNKFDMIVCDECHKMKNPSSSQGKNFLKLSAKYQVGLTGTLLVNNPVDTYVPLKWLGVDNSTFTNFKFYYCVYTGPFNNILIGYKNTQILKDQLDSCSLRRTKDLLDLPEKTVIHESLTMEDDQAKFYQNIVDGVVDQVDKVEMNTATVLSMVIRLRQATACPSILTSENISSAKINRAVDLAREIIDNGDKVVIFSVFKPTLDVIVEELKEYNPLLCTGDIKDSIISQNIDDFQNKDDNKVMCATTAKMGTGITLTRASYAIFVDCPWTASECDQCESRIYRIGSGKPVFIYYLEAENTFDERVREVVEDKEAMADFLIDGKISKGGLEKLKKYITDLK